MIKKEIEIIEIEWIGPFSYKQTLEFTDSKDYGLYQIYGTHNIFGEDTLLYIGKSTDQEFGVRLSQHCEWIQHEQNELKFYLGRIGGINQDDDLSWSNQIDKAEKLLIYFCSPPYNSSNINNYSEMSNSVIINFGRKNRIPYEVSSLYKNSDYFKNKINWKVYQFNK